MKHGQSLSWESANRMQLVMLNQCSKQLAHAVET